VNIRIEQLTKEELRIVAATQKHTCKIMAYHPLFVISPGDIQERNHMVVGKAIKELLDDKEFVKETGVPYDRLRFILYSAAGFEIWKRGLALYTQWILQFVAIGILWSILWAL
jgi:hypothetical protein